MPEFRIPSHVSSTSFNESTVLLDVRKNVYYALNDSASNFWQLLMQTGSYEAAVQEISKIYQESPNVIEKDMDELINSLVKSGLVERVK